MLKHNVHLCYFSELITKRKRRIVDKYIFYKFFFSSLSELFETWPHTPRNKMCFRVNNTGA